MDMNNNVKKHMDDLLARYPDLRDTAEKIHTLYFNLETVFFKNKTLFICGNGGSLGIIRRLAKEGGIVVKDAQEKKLSQLAGGASHQGVVAVGSCAEYASLEDILAVSRNKGTKPFIIICDEIEDPHNLGAIIRTAETVGADGVIIPKRRSASLNATVFKTSAGERV